MVDETPSAGPWGAPQPDRPRRPSLLSYTQRPLTRRVLSIIVLVSLLTSYSVSMVRDLSRPEAWAYWKDLYVSPSLTATIGPHVDIGGPHAHRALAIHGTIGAAGAAWFRRQLDSADIGAGDAVILSSPGGDVDQALIMGEAIRARGLVTAVGTLDAEGRIQASYCASACVLVYAGGKVRVGVPGSKLGVHRFTTSGGGGDAVADTQRTAGRVLGYMIRMGISPAIPEAMSQTSQVRWLDADEAIDAKLVTDPIAK